MKKESEIVSYFIEKLKTLSERGKEDLAHAIITIKEKNE